MSDTAPPCFVIAEAGVNHNGQLDLALRLVDAAAEAGADAVKFQTFRAERLVTAAAAQAAYQTRNTGQDTGQLAMLRALELDAAAHARLLAHCAARGLRFMSTAFDAESLDLLLDLRQPDGTPAIAPLKLPSGDLTAGPLLLRAARARRPMILSTGMATLGEVETALGVLAYGLLAGLDAGPDGPAPGLPPPGHAGFEAARRSAAGQAALQAHVTVLHCVTEYPAPPAAVHLRAMDTLATAFGLPIGYSDHCLGNAVALAAVARGACVIEKHLTLDRSLPGPDHRASSEPAEFRELVAGIRAIGAALGSARKQPADCELPNRAVARRSLVAARPLRAGQILTAADLDAKRPADGASPMAHWDWIGRPAPADLAPDQPFPGP